MKDQKLQNFLKTLLFQKNYGYIWTVTFFWFYIIYIILTLLFFGDTAYSNISNASGLYYYSKLGFFIDIPLILAFQSILKKYGMLHCGIWCQVSFLTSAIFLLLLLVIIFLINWMMLKLFVKNKK